MNGQIVTELERLGLPDILLWLLTFAIVFGLLSQIKIPRSPASRGMIAIAIAFLVILSAPAQLILFLSQASSSIILVVVALLVLIAFLEAAGIKTEIQVPVVKEGKVVDWKKKKISIFERYPKAFALAFIIIAILIFLGAGGWQFLGIQMPPLGSESIMGIVFLIAIILGVVWMIAESK